MSWDMEPPTKAELNNSSIGWDMEPPTESELSGPTSPLMSGFRKGLQGATAGFSDEAAGVVEGTGKLFGLKGLGGPLKDIELDPEGASLDLEKLKSAYARGRDRERKSLTQDSIDNPGVSGAAEIAGSIASPLSKLMPGASMAKTGAVMGGATGLGMSDAENLGDMVTDTAKGAGLGLAFGYAGDKATPYLEKGVKNLSALKQNLGNKFKDTGEKLAFKSSGAMLKDFRHATDGGKINELGRYILDEGLKVGDSVDDIAARAAASNKISANKLDDLYNQAGDLFKEKMSQSGFNPIRDKEEILVAAKKALGDEVGSESALNKLSSYLDEIGARHGDSVLSPRKANEIKSAIDRGINYSRNPLAKDPTSEIALSSARNTINQKNLDAIESLGGSEISDGLRAANKEYGLSKKIEQIAEDRINRNNANKMFGLTDTIAGGAATTYGAVTGDWKSALSAMALKKGLDKYGTTGLAVAADKIGKQLLKSPQMAELSTKNPQAFAAVVYNMVSKLEQKGTQMPAAAGTQDQSSNDMPMHNYETIMQKTQGSKYSQVLQNAAKNGQQRLAAAHFVLGTRDPEYKRIVEGN